MTRQTISIYFICFCKLVDVFESGKQSVDSRNGFLNMVKVPCIGHEVRSISAVTWTYVQESGQNSELLVSALLLSFDQ